MKTYLKTLKRMFTRHVTRFLSIIFIVLVSVGFITGLGCSVDKINYSLTDYYKSQNVSDFIVKSKKSEGFTEDEIAAVKERYGENNVNAGTSLDVRLEINGTERLTRLYFLEGERKVNLPDTIEKTDGEPDYAAAAEEADNKLHEIPLGTEIQLNFKDILTQLAEQNGEEPPAMLSMLPDSMATRTVTVTETVLSPLTFGKDGEPSYENGEDVEIPDTIDAVNELICLEEILYLSADAIPVIYGNRLLPTGDLYVALSNRSAFNAFSKQYESYLQTESEALGGLLGEEVRILTLHDNYSFSALHGYGDKVMGITWILMVAFLLVTILVVLSTMTRLIDEERGQVACLRTLGYPAWRIIFKYLLFAAIANGIGGTGGYFVGIGVARLIYIVFDFSFSMPPMTPSITLLFFLLIFCLIVAATLSATALSGVHMTNEEPAALLRPKVPKAGKKVVFERIPFFWNLLPFRYKSTTRNVLRFKSRFLMTVVAVAFSTMLVMAGLSLLDLCLFQGLNSPSLMGISILIVVFAGLLTAVVIYTLTNINISERNRELATLMVLGYYDKEVAGYIYREVYIDTVIGIIVGLPLSIVILMLLFSVMAIGSLAEMSWFVWLIAPVVVLLFTALVTLILRRKIVKIDMNESLKAIE